MKGSMVMTSDNVDIPARYGVVFGCEHGQFAIEGRQWITLWKRLKQGQDVEIQYRVVYRITKGKRTAVDLDFIDAK